MGKTKKIKTTAYKFPVIIEKDEDGFFVADCPDLQGCHSQGGTIEEAITNVRDAIELNILSPFIPYKPLVSGYSQNN